MNIFELAGPVGLLCIIVMLVLSRRQSAMRRQRLEENIFQAEMAHFHQAQRDEMIMRLVAEISRLGDKIDAMEREIDGYRSGSSQADRKTGTKTDPVNDALICLGLPITAMPTRADLKRAFVAAVKKEHPDQGGNPETIKKIITSYEFLKNHYGYR